MSTEIQQNFYASFKSFASPLLAYSLNGQILWANSGFEKLSGFAESELKEKSLGEIFHGAFGENDESLTKRLNDASVDFISFNLAASGRLFDPARADHNPNLRRAHQFGIYARASLLHQEGGVTVALIHSFPERIDTLLTRYTDMGLVILDDRFNILEYNDHFYGLTEAYRQRTDVRGMALSGFIEERDWKPFETRRRAWREHLALAAKNTAPWRLRDNPLRSIRGWKFDPEGAWRMEGNELLRTGPHPGAGFAICPEPFDDPGTDVRFHFEFQADNPEGAGFFCFGRPETGSDTPDVGGHLAIIHGHEFQLKDNCQTLSTAPFAQGAPGTWHSVTLEKTGGRLALTLDGRPSLDNFDFPPRLPLEQSAFGFFAQYTCRFRDLRVESRPSLVNLDLFPPPGCDIRFKADPRQIFHMKMVRRPSGTGVQNGAVFLNVTSLREKEQALARSEQAREALSRENFRLRAKLLPAQRWVESESPAMTRILGTLEEVSPSNASILLEGETGTGKEVLAQMIHQLSQRSGAPFIKVDCAALPENILESELFGHEKGAFTGAHERRLGRFELAHGGTVFLDEIGNLSPSMQVKLLRVLQDKCFERLGSSETLKSDFRLICATNLNLEALVQEQRFRQDLYYRINVVRLRLPPLRKRTEDVPGLVRRFVDEFREQHGKNVRAVSEEALSILKQLPWPGNVRELKNAIENAVLLSPGEILEPSDFRNLIPLRPAPERAPEVRGLVSKRALCLALKKSKGSVSRAAEQLGLPLPRAYYLLKTLHIDAKAFRPLMSRKAGHEVSILELLAKRGSVTLSQIAREIHAAGPVLNQAVTGLVRRGAVERRGKGAKAVIGLARN